MAGAFPRQSRAGYLPVSVQIMRHANPPSHASAEVPSIYQKDRSPSLFRPRAEVQAELRPFARAKLILPPGSALPFIADELNPHFQCQQRHVLPLSCRA